MVGMTPAASSCRKRTRNMGGPPIAFDVEDLAKLGALQCTQAEAAAWFGCSERTVVTKLKQGRYRDAWERGRETQLACPTTD